MNPQPRIAVHHLLIAVCLLSYLFVACTSGGSTPATSPSATSPSPTQPPIEVPITTPQFVPTPNVTPAPTSTPVVYPIRPGLVGIYYFSGWWPDEPAAGWWENESYPEGWRSEYPERVPLLGLYNDQRTMDQEISVAADYGVDFFSFLYYNLPSDSTLWETFGTPDGGLWLNQGLLNFMRSPNAHRMSFMIDFVNEVDFEVATDSEWEANAAFWVQAMQHPSYLRVEGKPVFMIYSSHLFLEQNSNEVELARARLESLRQAAREAGLGEMLVGGGVSGNEPIAGDHFASQLFDFTGAYIDIPDLLWQPEDFPYQALNDAAITARRAHTNDVIPYIPTLAAGFNARPWNDPRISFAFPTREEWEAALLALAADFEVYPALGLPLSNGEKQSIFTVYAWNEFGEGGIVAPTQGEQFMKLEGLQAVFGSNQ